jgi:hypothetical protein
MLEAFCIFFQIMATILVLGIVATMGILLWLWRK